MSFQQAQIVRSPSGHAKDQLSCALALDGSFVLQADGKRRRVENPKRKNVKHVACVGEIIHPTIEKVRAGEPVRNRELRAALAASRDEMEV